MTCHKELAELYEERLRERGLTVSIEPARWPRTPRRPALLDPFIAAYKMPRMTERLRALLQGIGPGGVRGGVAILALTLSLLVLVVVVVWYALSYGQVEATSEPEITVVSENEP